MTKIWIIIDQKIGNANQAIAVANAMGFPYETKEIYYNFLSILPNRLKFDSLIGVDLEKTSPLLSPYPDIVISSGRSTAPIARYIKLKSPSSYIIHIMNPDMNFTKFDLVALPIHDQKNGFDNVVNTVGAPTFLSLAKLEDAGGRLKDRLTDYQSPFIALIFGGKTKLGDYKNEEIIEIAKNASRVAKNLGASLLVSTSRRTDKNHIKLLQDNLEVKNYFYNFNDGGDNPYLGFLALAEYFIVSADSVSIISDCLSTGKPVYIYQQNRLLSKKHRKFLEYLDQMDYTRLLTNDLLSLDKWQYQPLKEAERLAKIIKERYNASINISC